MKKQIITTSILAIMAASAFGQGQVAFKTTVTKNAVFYSTDKTTATLALVAVDGTAGVLGAVNYEFYSAPNGTVLTAANGLPNFSGWIGTAVGAVTYAAPGVVSPAITITLPSASGVAGTPAEVELFAYTGSLGAPTAFGYSGSTFNGGSFTFSGNGIVYSDGALGWSQGTGNPNGAPPTQPGTLLTGATGLGALVLQPVPEPSTIALGGLGAAALLLFRRRK